MNSKKYNKELELLRNSVDITEKKQKRKRLQNPEITKIIDIVEEFIIKKKLICYGGTAINNILPEMTQFYDKELDLPDYDFFSPNAMEHAIELADLYYKKGYTEVSATAGMHYGTYKVFVNFIPIADITYLPKMLFKSLLKHSITFSNIHYAPPNYLRMSMYLELSRPDGDVSRWEKVFKRLTLLNNEFPGFSKNYFNISQCNNNIFQRNLTNQKNKSNIIFETVKNIFINHDVVFFGAFATALYGQYSSEKVKIEKKPDFDIIATNPVEIIKDIKKTLSQYKIENVTSKKHNEIGDIIPVHYEVKVGNDTIAILYKDNACHNYNLYKYDGYNIKIATIDTMLSYYLGFIYIDKPHFDTERLLCMSHYLFTIQNRNRLSKKGILKRFTSTCYGEQHGREDIRAIKQNKFFELKNKRNSTEYKKWFLKYYPRDVFDKKQNKKIKNTTKKTKKQLKKKHKKKNKTVKK